MEKFSADLNLQVGCISGICMGENNLAAWNAAKGICVSSSNLS